MNASQSKGAIFSLDGILATVAVVLIVYIGFVVFATFAERTNSMLDSEERESKLLLLSDHLVKNELTENDGARMFQHRIDLKKLEELDTGELARELGVGEVGVSLALGGQAIVSKGEGRNCVRRVVWVPEYEQVGYLETCIG